MRITFNFSTLETIRMSITPVYITAEGQYDPFLYYLTSERSPKRNFPILIGDYPFYIQSIPQYIYMNTEQLSRPEKLKVLTENRFPQIVEIWDYSLENVKILKEHNILAKHVALQSPDSYIQKLRLFREPYLNQFAYQVGFCGDISQRRSAILEELKGKGISVHIIRGISGDSRDAELAKCAILINIHHGDNYKIFESARCEAWLCLGVTVISENSLDNDSRCVNVPYNELVKTTIDYLNTNTKIIST
jgi:hypothetical protein